MVMVVNGKNATKHCEKRTESQAYLEVQNCTMEKIHDKRLEREKLESEILV